MAKNLGKRIRASKENFNQDEYYSLEKALELLEDFTPVKFDETVEIAAHLGVDPRQSSQMVRGTVSLPNGSGKQVRVLVFTENPDEANQAGASYSGLQDLIAKVKEGWLDFDAAIATPGAIKSVREVARVLGPRGLMPSLKNETVTEDIKGAVDALKKGRISYKMDKGANVSIVVGKRSFSKDKLVENTKVAIKSLQESRPKEFKGKSFMHSLTLTATMSPGVKLDLKQV